MRLQTSKLKCGNFSVPHYYLHHYLPLEAGKDLLSQSLIGFKQRRQPDLDTWIAGAVQSLAGLPVLPDTIVLRALRHEETTTRTDLPSSLDHLGHALAQHFRCRYIPTILAKTRTTLPNKHLTRQQRRSQLSDVYKVAGPTIFPADTPFLLIDDILTTGTTMRAIIRTLLATYPAAPLEAFTLARADYQPSANAKTV